MNERAVKAQSYRWMLGFLLRGCVGQGATIEEAIVELEENERVWLETAKEFGVPIPAVPER